MIDLYYGITEAELASVILEGKITSRSLGLTSLDCVECTAKSSDDILKALRRALVRFDGNTKCYVLELAINESQLAGDTEVLLTDGIEIGNIINVYQFELTPKLRLFGALEAEKMGNSLIAEKYGTVYIEDTTYQRLLNWYLTLNIPTPTLGQEFFSVRNTPVKTAKGLELHDLHDLERRLSLYVNAIKDHTSKLQTKDDSSLEGVLKIGCNGSVKINLSKFLDSASPLVIASVLLGNSKEIINHLEDIDPICSMIYMLDEMLWSIMPGNKLEIGVEFSKESVEHSLLVKDPEKYSLVMEARRRLEGSLKASSSS